MQFHASPARFCLVLAIGFAQPLGASAAPIFDPAREFAQDCLYSPQDPAAPPNEAACQKPADPKPEDPPKRPPWHIGDPPPTPVVPDPPRKPDPLKKKKYDDWLKKLGLGGCSLNIYETDQDLQRSGPTPEGQEDDPTAVSLPTIPSQGKCECKVAIESSWLDNYLHPKKPMPAAAAALAIVGAGDKPKRKPTLDEKVAHELCHCGQANRGNLPWRDPKGGVIPTTDPTGKVVPLNPHTETEVETDASQCSDALNSGQVPGGLSGPNQPRVGVQLNLQQPQVSQ